MPAKLNFFKTPASVQLVSSRTVPTSSGISGCYKPHRQTAIPGQKSIYETFLVHKQEFFMPILRRYKMSSLLLFQFFLLQVLRSAKAVAEQSDVIVSGKYNFSLMSVQMCVFLTHFSTDFLFNLTLRHPTRLQSEKA